MARRWTLKDRALRPVIVITSNSERRLPEPFLRRCIYHNIVLDQAMLERIVDGRLKQTKAYFEAEATFRAAATKCFFALRDNDNLAEEAVGRRILAVAGVRRIVERRRACEGHTDRGRRTLLRAARRCRPS